MGRRRPNPARYSSGALKCWGDGTCGRLGYAKAKADNVGDDQTPALVDPVDLGGAAIDQLAAGSFHACALVDQAAIYWWGQSDNGKLAYANEDNVGDDETPAAAGPVQYLV